MNSFIRVQTLYEAAYISHNVNISGKGMNAIILPSALGELKNRWGSLKLV